MTMLTQRPSFERMSVLADARNVKALEIVQRADEWTLITQGAYTFYGIQGSGPVPYVVDTQVCTCPDQQKRQRNDGPCKHIRAVRILMTLRKCHNGVK